jgi:5-methylcytosine-specific restriction endonuclease McrA
VRQGSDPRYVSRQWRKLAKQIKARDHYLCQIRGPRCTVTATQVDHIISPHPELGGGDFWAASNLRAACAPCNNHRNSPTFFKQTYTHQSPPANLSLQARFGPVSSDYTRKASKDGDSA